MAKIDLSNVIRVTLLTALRGLANINTSALAIITNEVPIPADYGTSRTYRNPTGVADDWGSDSDVYAYALAIFAQTPNIISGGGFLVIIPRDDSAAAQPATLSGTGPVNFLNLTAEDYHINAAVDGGAAADLEIGKLTLTDLAAVETALNSTAIVAAGLDFSLSGTLEAATVTLKTVATGSSADIELGDTSTGTDITTLLKLPKSLKVTGAEAGTERVKDTILRTAGSIEYFGIVLNEKLADAELTELAAYVQTLDKLLVVGSSLTADLTSIFSTLKDAGYTHTRTTLYTESAALALKFAAAYAGRAFSVNFDGIDTAQTMHLKDITGFVADSGLTQTLIDAAQASGTDVYADFGIPKVFTSGANEFFDFIYMSLAFKLRIQIAVFNALATTNTKIPQTEQGMNILKSACRNVCAAFVTNGNYAPGVWNDPTTFGDPADHIRNIAESGYFIYSMPIAEQTVAQREARVAPVIQIAGKSAGAIHSSDVTVFLEA